ncbi:MAG: NAD-dependent epimerase/dehydratase family protein [Pseudomonadota bacterium]
MKVFVSGSSSHLARALLPRLCAHPAVTGITGLDLMPPVYAHAKFRALQGDLRSTPLVQLLAGHNALIHLAWVVLRGRTSVANMHAVNIEASLALFRAAHAAGVTRFIHLSSAAVYGAGMQLTETAPLAPEGDFLYAQHKAELERLLAAEFPERVVLRPHIILGPHAQPLLLTLARQPFYPALPDPQPLLQCVHEDDVSQAILLCLEQRRSGTYNLASTDSFSFREVVRKNKIHCALPLPLIEVLTMLAWRLTGWGGEPGWVTAMDKTLTLDCSKARRELGWQPRYSARETLNRLFHR